MCVVCEVHTHTHTSYSEELVTIVYVSMWYTAMKLDPVICAERS